jgi:predicted ester cyclase
MEVDPVSVVREVIDALNNRTLRERAADLLVPTFIRHDLVQVFPDSEGPTGVADFVTSLLVAMPDFRIDIDDIFGSGDRVAVRLRMSGTHTGAPLLGQRAAGATLTAVAVFIYRVADGRLAEAWQMVDGLAFHRLVGLLDEEPN